MCDLPDVEPDGISEANYQNSFAISSLEDKENIEIFSTNYADDESFEVRSETAYGGQNSEFTISGSDLLCKNMSLLVRKLYGFHGFKSENTWSIVSVIQPKALRFH